MALPPGTQVLVTGASGQLARCLADTMPEDIRCDFLSRVDFDLTRDVQMAEVLKRVDPKYIINTAAYTNVDAAESDGELAYAVNHTGVQKLAKFCRDMGVNLVHVSTDFVFGGDASVPYKPEDDTAPLGVYGRTKRQGELAVQDVLPDKYAIVRTSWLYSEYGGNFVKTMLRLFESKDAFQVVNDQSGSPTYARGLAQFLWSIVTDVEFKPGVYHWCDKGVTSWFEFAQEIGKLGKQLGLLSKQGELTPISAMDYGSPTPRPVYSALDCSKSAFKHSEIAQVPWRENLLEMLQRLKSLEST